MLVRNGQVMLGEVSVFEETFAADSFAELADIETALYWAIRNNIDVYYSDATETVDIYVFGYEYLLESSSYYKLSADSVKIAVASTLVNFVVISEPYEE